MAFEHKISTQVQAGGITVSQTVTKTAGNRNSFDEPIADAQTDKLVNVAIDVSALQSFYMVSDQAVTIETNDGTTPQETIVLKANEPLSWIKGSNQLGGADYPAVPFGGDVTAFFVTNASGSAAQLKIEILQDPTP